MQIGSYDLYPLKVSSRNMRNYTYVVVDRSSREAAIVDPAWEYEKITGLLQELGVRCTQIWLTHSHHDHVDLAEPLMRAYGAQVYMSQAEIERYQYRCENLNPLHDLETVNLGETVMTCLLTPGHTAGSACFSLANSLFTGDTLFIEGCGICTEDGGDPEAMYHSVQRIKTLIRPEVRVYPGHSFGKSPGYTLSYLQKNNIYMQIERMDHFVSFRMRKNQGYDFNYQ